MTSVTRNPDEIKTIDALRLKKYTACYISQNRDGNFEKFVQNARAPIEYLFANHEFCDNSWCWSKEIDEVKMKVSNNGININVSFYFSIGIVVLTKLIELFLYNPYHFSERRIIL